jgi:hypothetical protein
MPEVRILFGDRNWNLPYHFLHGALAIRFPAFFASPGVCFELSLLANEMGNPCA